MTVKNVFITLQSPIVVKWLIIQFPQKCSSMQYVPINSIVGWAKPVCDLMVKHLFDLFFLLKDFLGIKFVIVSGPQNAPCFWYKVVSYITSVTPLVEVRDRECS